MNLDISEQNSENDILFQKSLANGSQIVNIISQSASFLPQLSSQPQKKKHLRFPSIHHPSENSKYPSKLSEILQSPKGVSRNIQTRPVFNGIGFTISESARPAIQYSLQQSGRQNSLLIKMQQVSQHRNRNESNQKDIQAKPMKEIFTITKSSLMKSVHILIQITGKNQAMLFMCRMINANSPKLSQCLQMISPPFYLNSNDTISFRTVNDRVKKVYQNFKRENPEINETVVYKYNLCLIEIQKLMRVFEFSGIELKFEKLLKLLSQIGLLFIDKHYGYLTEYLWFLSIIQLSYQNKVESTKLLMMSLQPEAKIKTAQLLESDIPKALLRLIEQRTKQNKVNQHRQIKLKLHPQSPKFIQIESTPAGVLKQRRGKIVNKKFGIEPPMNNALLVYDSQQDLYDTIHGDLNKYQFYSVEIGYLNILRNKHLIEEDPDLKEEIAIFGSEEVTEYPVWIRVLYQHTYFTNQIVRLTKIYFYDHENTARGNAERDFYSPSLKLEDCIISNHFDTLFKNSLNPINLNQIFNQFTINLKGRKENLNSIEVWPPNHNSTQLLVPDQYKDPIVYTKDPILEDQSDFEDDYNYDISQFTPLLVKQIQSYHIYFEQSRIQSSTTVITRTDFGVSLTSSENISDIFDQIKQAFQFTEQFLNNSQSIEFDSSIKLQFPYGETAESSEEEAFEITDSPLFITQKEQDKTKQIPQQPKLNRLKTEMSFSTISQVEQRPKTPKKKAAYHQINFNMEFDYILNSKNLNINQSTQQTRRFIQSEYLEDTMFTGLKFSNYQQEGIFGAHMEEFIPQSRVLIPIGPQFTEFSSEDVSFDEIPIHFEPKEFLENREENDEFEFCNGLVLKKELILNYENGAGVAQVDIYHKEKFIHSIEGLGENNKVKWSLKFLLPNKLRKFYKIFRFIDSGKNFKGLQLLTRQVGNKKFLTAFCLSGLVKQSEIDDEEKALLSPSSPKKTDNSVNQTPVVEVDVKDQSSIMIVHENFKFFELVPVPIKWRSGQFKIVIRYSSLYTILQEVELSIFKQKLQQFTKQLTDVFPQIKIKEIILNMHEISNPEQFEVLIRGVGQQEKRLAQNYYPLYIKNELLGIFLYLFERQIEEVYENLSLLSWFYGGTLQLAAAQREFLLNDQEQTKYPYKFVEP